MLCPGISENELGPLREKGVFGVVSATFNEPVPTFETVK
jgi:hypothetical protein